MRKSDRNNKTDIHIGDSTSAGNGSWARRLNELMDEGEYPELANLVDKVFD